MPNIKSQKDRVAQSKKEAAHNKAIKSNLKTVVKKADAAIDGNAADKDGPKTMTRKRTPPSRSLFLLWTLPRTRVSFTRTLPPARSAAWLSATTRPLLQNKIA